METKSSGSNVVSFQTKEFKSEETPIALKLKISKLEQIPTL